MAGASTGVRAVVWRAAEMPGDLSAALARQGIRWEEAAGPFDALSRVLAARQECPRSRVLLLVEPDALPDSDEVRGALERFDPHTCCWAYRAAASPRLAPLVSPTRKPDPEVIVRPGPIPRPRAELRLAGDAGAPAPEPPAPGGLERESEPRTPRSLLTAEELAMLLADDR